MARGPLGRFRYTFRLATFCRALLQGDNKMKGFLRLIVKKAQHSLQAFIPIEFQDIALGLKWSR